jgi:hemolysin D
MTRKMPERSIRGNPEHAAARLWQVLRGAMSRLHHGVKPLTERIEHGMDASRPLWWSRSILYAIIALIVILIAWSAVAPIDEVIPAAGRLRPVGTTREIQSPVAGVIDELLVQEGQTVRKGDVLARLDRNTTLARIQALDEVCKSLEAENSFYQKIVSESLDDTEDLERIPLSEDEQNLVRDRMALESENRLFEAQANLSSEGLRIDAGQAKFFAENERDRLARIEAARALHRQTIEGLAGAEAQLVHAEQLLTNTKQIVDSYGKLQLGGVVSRVEYLARESELIQTQKEVESLRSDIAKLKLEVNRTREEMDNINTRYRRDALDGVEQNREKIAAIDARLGKIRHENQQRLAESRGELTRMRKGLEYHDIIAPTDGIVFDLKHEQRGAVLAEGGIVMKIVPKEELLAEVFVTNEDIGFIRPGMPVRIRVDSFPAREFGEIPGELVFVGSDALPPTQDMPRYTFPCRVRLDRQHMTVKGVPIPLQAGMSVTTHIHVRNRTALNIFLDFLTRPVEQLKEVR